ncbi:hypothetical protein FQR65_LT09209 [Abscondita terminalis]|nr:hypothetical protein FQR65_LT09209 [Abscondita terminalis]
MSRLKKKKGVNFFQTQSYPNAYDVISNTMGQNIVVAVELLQKRKGRCFKALADKVAQTKLKSEDVEPYLKVTKCAYPNLILFELASSLPTMPITKSVIRAIRKKLSCNGLEQIYAVKFEELVQEVRNEFIEATHAVGVICVVKPLDQSIKGHETIACYKNLGRTLFYSKFLRIIERFKIRFIPTFSLMRKIVTLCVRDLPQCLFSVKVFRDKFYDISELYRIFDEEIIKAQTVIFMWYQRVMESVRRDKSKFPNYLRYAVYSCGTSLMATFLTLSIQNTIEHVLQVTENAEEIPFIMMNIIYEKRIILEPSISKLCELYIYLIRKLATLGSNLQSLESYYCDGYEDKLIPNFMLSDVVECYEKRMRYNIAILFEPVSNYVKNLNMEFAGIHSDQHRWNKELKFGLTDDAKSENISEKDTLDVNPTALCEDNTSNQEWEDEVSKEEFSVDLEPFLTGEVSEDLIPVRDDITFEEGYATVVNYKSYLDKLTIMRDNEHYLVGLLVQSSCRDAIRDAVYYLIEKVADRLCLQHTWLNEDICEQFEMIKVRALTVPQTSEELMELSTYMVWAATEYVLELTERIESSIQVTINLIEMTTLSQAHMNLNSKTIKWLDRINSIFEKNAGMIEACKTEFDERLQQTIITLVEDIENFLPTLVVLNLMDDADNSKSYLHHLSPFIAQIKEFDKILTWINKEEVVFKYPLTQIADLSNLKMHVNPFYRLVQACFLVLRNTEAWLYGPFEFLDHHQAEEIIEDLYKELTMTQKSYKGKIRQALSEGRRLNFTGVLDDPDPMSHPAPIKLCTKGIQTINNFRPTLHMMYIMCNDAILQRHWDEMSQVAGFDLTPNAGTTLQKLMNMGLLDKIDQYEVISMSAIKERELLHNLLRMQSEWDAVYFNTSTYKDTGIEILTALDDIQAVLDDHIIKTLTMRGSVFVKPYESLVREWYDKIIRINDTLEEWGKVQSQWLYLLPIFSSKDIVNQMPEEGVHFTEVNGVIRRYLTIIVCDPKVIETAPQEGLLENMKHCTELLEIINDGVANYLERKRLFFPRFFFLSNDEMLEILSETQDPLRVQPHLKKCFEGINSLDFDPSLKIHAMFSEENERVAFLEVIDTVAARGCVEKWLVQVECDMRGCVFNQLKESWTAYQGTDRQKWVTSWPGQVVLAVSQIFWTAKVHNALNAKNKNIFQQLIVQLKNDLTDIVSLVRESTITNLTRITIKALIVIDVHAKDVTEDLYNKNVKDDAEFMWLAQLRYYWEERCLVRIINATVNYANEYLGNSDRLVITTLTDRCYRTLVCAYHLHLNGAPEGPAGTGKTETIKDLAKAIAVQCVVFNCSNSLDYKAMGKFFKGLATSGAWSCFDEFNRIDVEVLSVVAQQILTIVLAIRAGVEFFIFEGTKLKLNPSCYVCITMNPGYAGRSELPDNLKVLFRTVAMMVPDYAIIAEISLYSYGFKDARKLSVKIVTTYRCCSEQLSSQNHYDYGMRAVKSVLLACGNNKRKYPEENEDILMLRSIVDVNLPKFLNHDVPLFEGIISDIFPGIYLPQSDHSLILSAVQVSCETRNLQLKECVVAKIMQTYEMMIVRHGFMLVGEPFAGKTTTLKVLADALSNLYHQGEFELAVKYQFINPKSVTMGQLYGQFDPISYEWFDGIVATCFRTFVTDPSSDRKWIIFDGPVDAVWIENMNTVLDDNKKLCLMSGEVMAMTNVMSMIFEVMDLAQASPATVSYALIYDFENLSKVSRCGMIYMDPSTLGWKPHVESWLPTCSPDWREGNETYILEILDWVVPSSLYFISKFCRQLCNAGQINLVKNMMHMIDILLTDACSESTKKEEEAKNMISWIQAATVTGMVWGLGSLLDLSSREKFDNFVKALWRGEDKDNVYPRVMEKLEIQIPDSGPLFDFFYMFKGRGVWKFWPDMVKNMKIEQARNIQQILVPTVDSIKYMYVLEMYINHKISTLLVGPTGTGKSLLLQDLLTNRLDANTYEPSCVTFTVKITSNQTQDLIISKLQKRKRGNYGPSKGKLGVIFVDDLNMPVKEVYGAQPPIELLRQYFDHKIWYDLKDTNPIYLHDILLIAAMGVPGGSRQDTYARFLRHFSIFSVNEFSDESMCKIYSNVLHLGWKNNGFPSDIIQNVNQVVNATLEIYQWASNNLLPTPSKSHYLFNLRDFSRIIYGCALLRKESVDNKTVFSKIWVHEVLRVIYDRLVDSYDKQQVYHKLRCCVQELFKEDFDHIFENLQDENGTVTEELLHKLMFGTYLDTEGGGTDLKYEEVLNMETFINRTTAALEDYNSTHKNKMNVVLFTYALEHLSKICRILSLPSGSALFVGVSGSGRQSLTKLATVITGHTFFQPEITINYGVNEWREDIKKVVKEAGGRGKQTVFLITESQIKEDVFLQDIDGLLNSGEVPNIFKIDEKQEILELVRLTAQGGNRNLDLSPLVIFSYFVKRTREKLHMCLCCSPIGSSFRLRLQLYPSLVNCCTIDWFEDWPEHALEMVALSWMRDVNLESDIKDSLVLACKYFHVSARTVSVAFFTETNRRTYITSASYLELIKTFTELTNNKQIEFKKNKARYVVGLEKLQFAAEQILQMQIELETFQPELQAMSKKATEMMVQIEKETREVAKASNLVRKDEVIANAQAAEAQALKAECEADLALAIPILEEAIDALNTLKPTDITLVKSMKNPPEPIKLVMAAVCVMKDIKPDRLPDPSTGRKILDYWGPSKRILGDMNFLQSLKDYDKDHIKPEIMAKIRKEYLVHKDFVPRVVAKASSAAEGLCKWIIAMDMYDKVAKEVAPKKAKLEEAEKKYGATMTILVEKKLQVARLEEKLANLNAMLLDATEKKENLQDRVDLCASKLLRANQLIDGLGGEKARWITSVNSLQHQYDCVAGDILLSCGIISYLSPFSMQWRLKAISDWLNYIQNIKIPVTPTYDFATTLGSELKTQNWYIAGLPRDGFSTGNAIIQENSKRWSLLIDPQSQANMWIKTMEKKNELCITKFSDKEYMKVIKHCIESGKPALVENVAEDLEAPIDALLFKLTFKQAGVMVIDFGDDVITYHPDFKLYLTSKLRNPHYLPEIFNKVTIINFALTLPGLEDQLLGIVVAKERPDLQRRRDELIMESAENKTALAKVEDMILRTLSESKGDILEDETAIEILNKSKIISTEIIAKQIAAKDTEEKIEISRLDYKPVSVHSARLYYCISDLPNIDPMYQYSLAWFINLYVSSIDRAGKSRELRKRISYLQENFTYNLYANVCRSLFERDKVMFSFLLCTRIMASRNKVDEAEYIFLLTGGVDVENVVPNPASTWLSAKSWNEICRLDKVTVFEGIKKSFTDYISSWKELYDLDEPQNASFPEQWQKKLSPFQRLLIIRVLRPDKITVSITKYVAEEMGSKYIIPPTFDIVKSFEQQGQGIIAQALVEQGQEEGSWVCLQNCHFAVSWMVSLEKLCESLDIENTHTSFRLWLTSCPCEQFPVGVLQNSVKMTNEPPTGLQQNLLKSYLNEPLNNESFYTGCPGNDTMFARLLYGLAFFHAVIQERRCFGPLGWNIPYGFNESDFDISVKQLQMFINEYTDNPYEGVCYLTGECNYGGRVTDDWDRLANLNYTFSTINEYYNIPKKPEYDYFVEHIKSLPQLHPPEIYGLHHNAGITRDLTVSNLLLNNLILVQGEGSVGVGDEEGLLSLIVSDIFSKLPKGFDLEIAQKKFPVRYEESMNTVLVQEMKRFTKLLNAIRLSLLDIENAIKGLAMMTPTLETLQMSLLLSRIPESWARVSYPSLKTLPNYITDFVDRMQFLHKWFTDGKPDNFWISGFFFPQAFLTGAKQNYARKYSIPIDQITFDFNVLKVTSTQYAPDDGIYVYGLFAVGARWDIEHSVLTELYPKILHDSMPLIWLIPILASKYHEIGRYKCPLYKTSERRGVLSTTGHSSNYVLHFLLNSNQDPSHWIKRSVALLCQLD